MFDQKRCRKSLNDSERKRFLKAAKALDEGSWKAFCVVLYYTGCRISEALHLTAERLDSSQKCLVFETLKRRRSGGFRAVPIPETLIGLIQQQSANLSPDALLFPFSRPTAYRWVMECMEVGKIKGAMASPRGLRHGFAIACVAKNIPLT